MMCQVHNRVQKRQFAEFVERNGDDIEELRTQLSQTHERAESLAAELDAANKELDDWKQNWATERLRATVAEAEVESLAAEIQRLRDGASALILKLDAAMHFVIPKIIIRGRPYKGPTLGEELEALRKYLASPVAPDTQEKK